MNCYADWKSKKNLNLPSMAIDHGAKLFFSSWYARHHFRFNEDGKAFIEKTETNPIFIHYNWRSKAWMKRQYLTWKRLNHFDK